MPGLKSATAPDSYPRGGNCPGIRSRPVGGRLIGTEPLTHRGRRTSNTSSHGPKPTTAGYAEPTQRGEFATDIENPTLAAPALNRHEKSRKGRGRLNAGAEPLLVRPDRSQRPPQVQADDRPARSRCSRTRARRLHVHGDRMRIAHGVAEPGTTDGTLLSRQDRDRTPRTAPREGAAPPAEPQPLQRAATHAEPPASRPDRRRAADHSPGQGGASTRSAERGTGPRWHLRQQCRAGPAHVGGHGKTGPAEEAGTKPRPGQ